MLYLDVVVQKMKRLFNIFSTNKCRFRLWKKSSTNRCTLVTNSNQTINREMVVSILVNYRFIC